MSGSDVDIPNRLTLEYLRRATRKRRCGRGEGELKRLST
jgi:hypothetical protein